MLVNREFLRHGFLILLLLVISSNLMLYHTTFGVGIIPSNSNGVVIGSIVDLSIISPILFIAWMRKWNWKYAISAVAAGLILTRFLIPMEYLAPFEAITWVGFAIEGLIVLVEVAIIISFVVYIPKIIQSVKQSSLPVLFSFHHAVSKKVKNLPIIHVICSEMIMFYYAFASWKKYTPRNDDFTFTLHQKSSFIAFQVMLIHAIILESFGLHWWLHGVAPIFSIIVLILNLYGVILLIGDIQAVRLNPTLLTNEKLYLSLGLMKRMEIEWANVEWTIDDPKELEKKPTKGTIEFIAKDLEKVHPTVILQLKQPTKAVLLMGMKREYNRVAIRVDEPTDFMKALRDKVER